MQLKDENIGWTFPELSFYADINLQSFTADTWKVWYEAEINKLKKELNESKRQINELQSMVQQQSAMLSQQKAYFDDLINNINTALPTMNDSMIDIFIILINKFMKAFLFREIQQDADVLREMIKKMLDDIKHEGFVEVEVSQASYELLMGAHWNPECRLKINASLKDGDLVLKCNTGIYMHKIDRCIDDILGIQHV